MRHLLSLIVLALLAVYLAVPVHADVGSGSGSAIVMAGSGSGSAIAAPPSSQLHDPTADPAGAIADVKALKARWPLLVLAVLIALTKALTFASGKLAPLGTWLAVGKRAMIVAAVGALAATAYDSLASGGTWLSAALVVGAAVLALISPHAPVAAQVKAAA